MIAVIDASALMRLFIPDGPVPQGLEAFFQGVESGRYMALAPELLMAEAASVIHKKRRLGLLSDKEGALLLTDVLRMPIRLFPHPPLLPMAFELAGQYSLTVYDSLYLALAAQKGADIFSADANMTKAALSMGIAPA